MSHAVASVVVGYSGLIYAVIVAAWAAVLVPRWVRRNEEVERAREADTVRGVRVLQRRAGRGHAAHEVAAPVGDAANQDRPDAPARSDALVEGSRGFTARSGADAASRRRRILVALVSLYLVTTVAAVTGRAPTWLSLTALLFVVAFLFLARRAAVAQARERRLAVGRPSRASAAPRSAQPVRAADEGSQSTAATHDEGSDRHRRLVVPDEFTLRPDADDSWEPIPVPLPTYVTKPKAPRVARKIDLSSPGAWTSGRLDPASPVVLPHRDAPRRVSGQSAAGRNVIADDVQVGSEHAEADELPEQRRAIGD